MPMPKAIGQYDDVRAVLDTALEQGGGTYELPTYRKAVRWRMRAYYFRTLMQKLEAENAMTSVTRVRTKYDCIVLSIEDNLVTIRLNKPEGTLRSPDGDEVDVGKLVIDEVESDLDREALELAKTLGVEDEQGT